MSSRQPDPDPVASSDAAQERSAPVLPKRGDAESPSAWAEDGSAGAMSDDEWLREVPPHHG